MVISSDFVENFIGNVTIKQEQLWGYRGDDGDVFLCDNGYV
jgi:hypothetical protein